MFKIARVLQKLARVPVKLIYLFPILLIPKAGLWFFDHPAEAWITLAYVGLLVSFFSLCVVILIFIFFVDPQEARQA